MKKKDKRTVPVISQIDETESGAASLCMILGTYGKFVDLSEMRKACSVTRDGCSAENIVEAAGRYGMKAEIHHGDPFAENAPLPGILQWKQDHWLVLDKVDEKGIRVVDPAYGGHHVQEEEFKKAYSGTFMTFEPTAQFQPGGKPFSMNDTIRGLMRGRKSVFRTICFLCLMLNLVGLLIPGMTRLFVDYYLPSLGMVDTSTYFLIFAMLLAVQLFLLVLKKKIDLKFQRIQSADMTGKIVRKLLRLPMSYFQTRTHATIVSQLSAIDNLTDFVSARLIPVVFGFVFSLVYIGLLFHFSLKLAAFTVGLIFLVMFFLMVLVALSQAAAARTAQDQAKFYGSVTQSVRLFDTIKSVALEDTSFEETMTNFSTWLGDKQSANSLIAVVQAVPLALPLLIQTVVICVGGMEVINNRMTIGGVLACQSLAMSIFAPLMQFVQEFAMLQLQKGAAYGLYSLLRETTDPRLKGTLSLLQENETGDAQKKNELLRGEVELRDIRFSYDESLPPVVENISVHIPVGHSAAFVGASGSGKSTLVKLLLGLYVPQNGQVLLDGKPRDSLDRETIAASLAVVSQTPFVFTGTVRDNITLFDRSISMEEVERAAREACVYEAIEAHPGGFNAHISPVEASFSGGEIQRIMIARALVHNPSILLMDEATSALDTVVEEEIMRNIRAKGITTLIVAHRLSTIRDSDEIIVLKSGSIIERGTHEQLMEIPDGVYRELINSGETDN